MSERNTVVRSLHDLSLAAWFGGTLAGAIGINSAAAAVADERERLRVANAGWARWGRVTSASVAVHLVSAAAVAYGNKGRVVAQRGVAASSMAKTAVTVAAVGATAWSAALGRKLDAATGTPVEGSTEPAPATPPAVEKAQRQMRVLQWAVPVLTGAVVVLNAVHGEQQRPSQVLPGILRKPAELLRAAA
ncbi:MAG TPA: hypothetical protein VD903_12535 [Pseudonocardia sp.]|nr:hypothetical protein [Pseudonocardia sp.]